MQGTTVFILSGPAGVGKTTLWNAIKQKCQDHIEKVTTTTSRYIRHNEVEGVDYYFIRREDFLEKIANHELIEYAIVHNNYYGSTLNELERIEKLKKSPIYIIEPQGMVHIKPILEERGYKVVTIFLLPPTIEALFDRIKGRGTETEEQLQLRIATAITELEQQALYDIRLINEDQEKTSQELLALLTL